MKSGIACGLLFFLASSCTSSTSTAEPKQAGEADSMVLETPALTEEDVPQDRRDVLYYYRQLKTPYAPAGYVLKESAGRWFSISPSTEEPLDAVVDIKNGFIEIVDPGTGGGDWTFRVALFRMADGNPVLGITHTFFDGAALLQDYYFLRPEDTKQLDWTRETIKRVSGFDFLPLDNAEEEDIVEKLLPVSLELPRQGTSVKATVYTGLKNIYCRGDENEYSDYCGLFQQVRRKEIIFKWNRDNGKFIQ